MNLIVNLLSDFHIDGKYHQSPLSEECLCKGHSHPEWRVFNKNDELGSVL